MKSVKELINGNLMKEDEKKDTEEIAKLVVKLDPDAKKFVAGIIQGMILSKEIGKAKEA